MEEWILCLIECALLKKCSLQSTLKCFFPISSVCSLLASRSSYSGSAHNLTIVGVRASPEEKNAIWKGLLVLFCLLDFSFAFKYLTKTSSLLPFCLLVTFFTVTSERRIHVKTNCSILTFWILELLCLTVMGCLVIFIIFGLLPPYAPYICESFSDDSLLFKRRQKFKLSNISKNNPISSTPF